MNWILFAKSWNMNLFSSILYGYFVITFVGFGINITITTYYYYLLQQPSTIVELRIFSPLKCFSGLLFLPFSIFFFLLPFLCLAYLQVFIAKYLLCSVLMYLWHFGHKLLKNCGLSSCDTIKEFVQGHINYYKLIIRSFRTWIHLYLIQPRQIFLKMA